MLLDANVLIEAHMAGPRHEAMREWLDEQLWGAARVGLPWESLGAFLRLVTNPRVFDRPQSIAAAWAQVSDWLGCECVWTPLPGGEHATILGRLLTTSSAGANLVPDARLAALAIEHGLVLVTSDAGFARFRGLKWKRPLE
ncbi:MAG: PIN domain-containing protein [Myxococcaceae bacterium]|nr:PIN domain-containing protein [Myxococcaceae bacterium]